MVLGITNELDQLCVRSGTTALFSVQHRHATHTGCVQTPMVIEEFTQECVI